MYQPALEFLMKLNPILLTTAAALILGFGASAYAADTQSGTGTGVEESNQGQSATNKNGVSMKPDTGAGASQMKAGPNAMDQGGTGVKGSEQGNADSGSKSSAGTSTPMGASEGPSAGTMTNGSGVESSSQGAAAPKK
jgi:hypothetical protein